MKLLWGPFLCLAVLSAAAADFQAVWNASVGADGLLRIDSTGEPREFEWARYALAPKDGALKPNARYKVFFRAKVEGGVGAYLFPIIRPEHFEGADKDVCAIHIPPTAGLWKDCEMAFTTGPDADYRLQFHSHNRVKAEVSDLKIVEVSQLRFTEVKHQTTRTTRPAGLPSGAREFEVDLPRPMGGPVLYAADFGVSVDNPDNTAALRKAFAEAKMRKASKLVLSPGDYRLSDATSLELKGFEDFAFDGRGARFVSSRKRGPFLRLRQCVRTRLMNFSIDWDWDAKPLASIVEVKSVGEDGVDLLFRDYDDFPDKRAAFLIMSPFDPAARSVGVEGMYTRELQNTAGPLAPFKGRWIGPNMARLKTAPSGLKVGETYRLQHYYYHMNGIEMDSNEHLRLENVKILSTPGHAFVILGTQHHTLFDHVDIVPPKDDPRRVITCTADHLHVVQSRGFIKLDHCEFSLGGDDIFNMHDCSGFAYAVGPRTIRTQNARYFGGLSKGTKVELRQDNYAPTGFTGTVAGEKAVAAEHGVFDIEFEENLPRQTGDGFIMFDKTYDTHNVIVRDCLFHDNRARGLLILARDVTVEGNVFRHQEMGAIKIETGYTLDAWSEGYGVSNVVVRGNLFESQNPSGSYSIHRERTIYVGTYLRHDPSEETTDFPIISDILFEGNTFRNSCGVAAYVTSAKNVAFLGNIFDDPTPRRRELPYRAQLYFSNVDGVMVLGNDYRPSPFVAPGVTYDPLTCRRVEIR